jgi:RNA polymerase sigma-70 factor (ECF subfamily)
MPADSSFDDVMVRLRTGDNDAAVQVFHRFSNSLIGLARERLGPQIQQKFDPEDVLQSVFRSLFARQAAGEFDDVRTWDSLWGMLVVITVRKCRRRIRFFRAACRDVERETPLADRSGVEWQPLLAADPSPEEAALFTDLVDELLGRFKGRQRDIVALTLQGYDPPEISSRLQCTERTVYRVVDRVKEWLERRNTEDDDEEPRG